MLPFPPTAHNSLCSLQEKIMMSCSELPQIKRYCSLPSKLFLALDCQACQRAYQ